MEVAEIRKQLSQTASTLVGADWDHVTGASREERYRAPDLAKRLRVAVIEFAEAVSPEVLPVTLLRPLVDAGVELSSAIERARSFNPATHTIHQLTYEVDEAIRKTDLPISMARVSGEVAKITMRAEDARQVSEFAKRVPAMQSEVEEIIDKANSAVREMQRASTERAVAERADVILKAEAAHKFDALLWAAGTAVVAAVLLGFAIWATLDGKGPPAPDKEWSTAGNLSHYGARLLGTSVLSFLMVMCAKNYRSSKHNQTVNEHRRSALETYDKFKHGGHQEIIVALAGQAIFGAQSTGYSTHDSSQLHVDEVLRMVRSEK